MRIFLKFSYINFTTFIYYDLFHLKVQTSTSALLLDSSDSHSVSSTSFISAVSSQEDLTLVNLHMQVNKPIVDSPLLISTYINHLSQVCMYVTLIQKKLDYVHSYLMLMLSIVWMYQLDSCISTTRFRYFYGSIFPAFK